MYFLNWLFNWVNKFLFVCFFRRPIMAKSQLVTFQVFFARDAVHLFWHAIFQSIKEIYIEWFISRIFWIRGVFCVGLGLLTIHFCSSFRLLKFGKWIISVPRLNSSKQNNWFLLHHNGQIYRHSSVDFWSLIYSRKAAKTIPLKTTTASSHEMYTTTVVHHSRT